MCRRPGPWGIALSALLSATPALAQEDPRVALQSRLDSLLPLLDTLTARVEQERTAHEAAAQASVPREAPLDTLRIGPLTVLSRRGQVEAARAVFAEALDGPLAKIDGSPAWEGRLFAYRDAGSPPIVADRPLVLVTVDPREGRSVAAARLRTQLTRLLPNDLMEASSSPRVAPVARWLGVAPVDEPRDGLDPASLYRRVALTRSSATRSCLGGDVEACIGALGLQPTTRGVSDWYEPEEIVELATRMIGKFGRTELPEANACTTGRDPASCERLLDRVYDDWAPIGTGGRLSLLVYAVEVGPPGGWGRAIEHADAPTPELLETVADMPVDRIVAGWRARLVANRTGPHVRLASQGALALLWTLVFAGLASRSTRWRMG